MPKYDKNDDKFQYASQPLLYAKKNIHEIVDSDEYDTLRIFVKSTSVKNSTLQVYTKDYDIEKILDHTRYFATGDTFRCEKHDRVKDLDIKESPSDYDKILKNCPLVIDKKD